MISGCFCKARKISVFMQGWGENGADGKNPGLTAPIAIGD
jgi:hypothetical protein